MKTCVLSFATLILTFLGVTSANAGDIYSITYADVAQGSTTDLTAAGSVDWVKWGNGEPTNTMNYATPEKIGGSVIDPTLTPLGSPPPNTSVVLEAFAPVQNVTPLFSWTDGTIPMHGGNPVGTSVTETILPAQSSYPLGLGLSFQATAESSPLLLTLYVAGFDARMKLTATLSGGASDSLTANNAALIPVPVPGSGNNYLSYGIFSIDFAGAGETLTVNLTADNQSGIPTDAPQYVFRNAGALAATVTPGFVPEPSSLVLSVLGFAGVFGYRLVRRTYKSNDQSAR
jgi:hypothetical protein